MAENKNVLSSAEISSFCEEIAMMLSAGMPLYDGIEALAQTYSDSTKAALYQRVSEGMMQTGSLYETLKEEDGWPAHMLEMTGIGEKTGRLEEVMKGLAIYYGREDRIRSAVVSAVTYPVVLAIMLCVIVLVMLVAVLPVFRRMLGSMGISLTAGGSALTAIGFSVGWIVLALVGAAIVAVFAIVLAAKLGNRQAVIDRLNKLFVPARRINAKLAASRVFSVLSMMLSSGFSMEEALSVVPPVISDKTAAEKVEKIQSAMNEGASFGDALEDARILDEMHTRMIRMAVKAGREDEVMAKTAQLYEEQVEEEISNLVSIIEPTLVALLCLVIGGILLVIMMPMAGVISSII